MKIASSTVQWQSKHTATRLEMQTSRLEAWTGQRPTNSVINNSPSEISNTVAATADIAEPEAVDLDSHITPLQRLMKQLIEKMTGLPVNVIEVEPASRDAVVIEDPHATKRASNDNQPTAPRNAGWGLAYDSHYVLEESESTQWSAQGVVKTADGREINFQVDLQMQRYYREESSLSIREGDAKVTDPLVINFDGNAAELSDLRFSFDLNSDGQQENVPMLTGNRGFLALDINNNNRIDNGRELFGPSSGYGFSELAALDNDRNGWIDENDTAFNDLRVWMPSQDGKGTLATLQEKGVGAISLAAGASEFALRTTDNRSLGQVRATSAYLFEDGRAGTVQQIDFVV